MWTFRALQVQILYPQNIVWYFGGNPTLFEQTDTTENRTTYNPTNGTFSFTEGNKTSTLHIMTAEYPTNNGVYTCSSSNDTGTVDDTITVVVQGWTLFLFLCTHICSLL